MTAAARVGALHSELAGAEQVERSALDLVARRVWLHAKRRAAWIGRESPSELWPRGWDTEGERRAEAEFFRQSPAVQPLNSAIQETETALASKTEGRLRLLQELFLLDPIETNILHTCLAFALVPDLGRAFGEPEGGPVTLDLVARLFGYGLGLSIAPDSGLRLWKLVREEETPAIRRSIACDADVVRWLVGGTLLDAGLLAVCHRVPLRPPLPSWPVASLCARARSAPLDGSYVLRFVLRGMEGTGRKTCAAAVADKLGFGAIAIDTSAIADSEFESVFGRILRLAALERLAVIWYGTRLSRPWPRTLPLTPLHFIACGPDETPPPAAGAVDELVTLPLPDAGERAGLWRAFIPACVSWPSGDLQSLVFRHRLTPGDIVRIGQHEPETPSDASDIARALHRDGLGELGKLMECPFDWDDLVVGAKLKAQLSDFAFEARDRLAFWQNENARRLFPRGRGLAGLMTGSPGTGKTMAAQVVARDLGLDLIRVDMATVVDKYIGETAKNLRRIFSRAAQMDAVLLFDEADALFSRRTDVRDAHDRYANADTNYLLQLLEDYAGVAILATNRWNNIDSAFMRRLRYVFAFAKPGLEERHAIWMRVVGELAPDRAATLATVLRPLAETFEISGAQVKNASLAAMFSARRERAALGAEHLLMGIERELEKTGRAISPQERDRVMQHAK